MVFYSCRCSRQQSGTDALRTSSIAAAASVVTRVGVGACKELQCLPVTIFCTGSNRRASALIATTRHFMPQGGGFGRQQGMACSQVFADRHDKIRLAFDRGLQLGKVAKTKLANKAFSVGPHDRQYENRGRSGSSDGTEDGIGGMQHAHAQQKRGAYERQRQPGARKLRGSRCPHHRGTKNGNVSAHELAPLTAPSVSRRCAPSQEYRLTCSASASRMMRRCSGFISAMLESGIRLRIPSAVLTAESIEGKRSLSGSSSRTASMSPRLTSAVASVSTQTLTFIGSNLRFRQSR